jgi:hypothetical protein
MVSIADDLVITFPSELPNLASVARMERSEIRGGIDASRQSRITLRSIGAAHLNGRAKIASCESFRLRSIFDCGRLVCRRRCDPMFRGNKAAASMTYKENASPIQRPHLTTVAAWF